MDQGGYLHGDQKRLHLLVAQACVCLNRIAVSEFSAARGRKRANGLLAIPGHWSLSPRRAVRLHIARRLLRLLDLFAMELQHP